MVARHRRAPLYGCEAAACRLVIAVVLRGYSQAAIVLSVPTVLLFQRGDSLTHQSLNALAGEEISGAGEEISEKGEEISDAGEKSSQTSTAAAGEEFSRPFRVAGEEFS